jgi:hypothetical protein
MWNRDETCTDADDRWTLEHERMQAVIELEEALTLAAAAPGRRRLERLEELLRVRAAQASNN